MVPPKIRMFLWRCCFRSLPVKERLKDRKVTNDSTCPRCGYNSETLTRCLLNCPYARQVWALFEISYATYNYDAEDVVKWFKSVISKSDSSEFGLFITYCWWIWFSRNKFIWESSEIQPHTLCTFAGDYYRRYQQSTHRFAAPKPNRTLGTRGPPPHGCIKINMDAALGHGGESIGIGLIARNWDGECVGWSYINMKFPLNPESAEAIVALRAIEFDKEKGWRDLSSNGMLGPIYEDIKLLAKHFTSFDALHVFRKCNKAAHCLARLASIGFSFSSFLPSSITEIVLFESL
ncbi:hypothetical protein ACJIZ3_019935 [Penstemon smallii]|uniref:Reverse transcriptase zinc-binding domain-containing protein n=1 Tax=Penstemon smallii TaxID=265156 RepID=A0ABD3T3V2_9LAMI